jgi:Uma2 family endonuclease
VVLRAERPAIVVQPDVLFIAATQEEIIQDVVRGAPDLVVEVVSPGSERADGVVKRDLYAAHGVREYWLVWPDEARIDVFTRADGPVYPAPRSFGPGERVETPLLPGFALEVDRVFAGRAGA